VARGPGWVRTGAEGGGDGEASVRDGIAVDVLHSETSRMGLQGCLSTSRRQCDHK
jgi:hypothetical protein